MQLSKKQNEYILLLRIAGTLNPEQFVPESLL